MPIPRLYGRAQQERFGHRRSTLGASTLSYSYDETRTILSGDDESTIQPPHSPWRGLENFLLGASQSVEHITSEASSSDDEETVDETRDGANFFKPYPLAASTSAESRAAGATSTFESQSFEVPNHLNATGKDKAAASDPVQLSPVYDPRGGVFEGWRSPPSTTEDWQRQRSETTVSLLPISPTGNPVVLNHPPHFRQEAKTGDHVVHNHPPHFRQDAKLKQAIVKTLNRKPEQPQPLYNKSMNREQEHPQQKTADPSHGANEKSPGCAILPIWSLEEDEIVFEGAGNDIERPALWNDPRLWSSTTKSRKPRDIELQQEQGGKEDADLLVRGADAKQSDSGNPDNGTKKRGLFSRLKPKAGVKVLQNLQGSGNKYLRNVPDKSSAAIDTRQCQEDAREVDVVYWPSPVSDPAKTAIVSPREPADEPPWRKRMSPPGRQRVSPAPTPTLLVETQDLQAPSPKREDLDSPRKNILRTRIPRFPTSPFSPLSDGDPSNVRISAPGAEGTEGIEVAEKSPRKKILSQTLARAFKTSKVTSDDAKPKIRPELHSVATSSTVDDNIELTTENWKLSVSKWFEFSPTSGKNAGDDDSEGQETQIDTIGPEGPEKESTQNVASEAGHPILSKNNATIESEPKLSPRPLPEYLPKSAVKSDMAALTLAAVATPIECISPSKTEEQLFPKMNRMGKKREKKALKTFQAPTSPKAPTMKARTGKKKAPVTSTNSLLLEKKVSDLSEPSKERQLHSPFGLMVQKSKRKESNTKPPLTGLGTPSANASPPDTSKLDSRISSPKQRKNASTPNSSKLESRISSPKPRKNASPPDSSKFESINTLCKHHTKGPLPLQKPLESDCKIKAGDPQISKVEKISSKLNVDLPANQESAVVPYNTAVSQPGCIGGQLDLKRATTPRAIPSRTPLKSPPVVFYPILDFNPCHAELLLGDDGSINLLGDDESIISRLESKDSAKVPGPHEEDSKADAQIDKTDFDRDNRNSTSIELPLETIEERTPTVSTTKRVRQLMNSFAPKMPARKNSTANMLAPVKAPFRALLRGDKRKAERNRASQETTMNKDDADPQTAEHSALDQTEGNIDHQKAVGQAAVAATELVLDTTACRVFFEQDLFESCLKPRYAELPGRLGEGMSPVLVEPTKPAIRKGRFSGLKEQVQVDPQESTEAVSSGTYFGGGLATTLQALALKTTCAAHGSTTASQGGHSQRTAKASNKNKEHEKHENASVSWSLPSSGRSEKSSEKDRKERERLEKVKDKLARRVNNDVTLLHSERSMEKDRKEGERLEGVKEKLARRLTADLKLLALVEKKKAALFSSDTATNGKSSKESDKYLESLDTMLIMKAIDDLVNKRMDEEEQKRKDAAAKENSSYLGNVLGGMFACSAPVVVEEPKSTKGMFEA